MGAVESSQIARVVQVVVLHFKTTQLHSRHQNHTLHSTAPRENCPHPTHHSTTTTRTGYRENEADKRQPPPNSPLPDSIGRLSISTFTGSRVFVFSKCNDTTNNSNTSSNSTITIHLQERYVQRRVDQTAQLRLHVQSRHTLRLHERIALHRRQHQQQNSTHYRYCS